MQLSDRWLKYLIILPAVIVLVLVTVYPSVMNYFLSFQKVTTVTFRNPSFNGLENYIKVATLQPIFWSSLYFSLILTAVTVLCELILGTALALLFFREFKGRRVMISLIITPLAVAPCFFGIMVNLMLNRSVGVVPYALSLFGMSFSPFQNPYSAFLTLVGIDIIRWTPFVFLIVYTALMSLPRTPYEAALIDGASSWGVFRYVTFPLLKGALLVAIVFRMMEALNTFDTIYVLTGGGPGTITTTISIYIYRLAFVTGNLGQSAAATVLLFFLFTSVATIGVRILYRAKVF